MSDMTANYAGAGEEMVSRILALIPSQPQILDLESAWGLFKVPGFVCADLEPTFAQASAALAIAKRRYMETVR